MLLADEERHGRTDQTYKENHYIFINLLDFDDDYHGNEYCHMDTE
jgi:hypothetical protein